MNVPLSWLKDYVTLPDSVQELTDRLTMIGHMLDKQFEKEGDMIIDLELRGNRADLFGIIGIARDISAAWNTPLHLPETENLPAIDPKSPLVTVEATDLVYRFTACTVFVTVGPSPDWMVKRLSAYGMASINSVVDITNYVMIETGIPIHAFDKNKLRGNRLIMRRAKNGERMTTFMGESISLTPEDLVLADEQQPQAITLVGNRSSGTTQETKEILIEAAVYNYASVRRTSRRLGIRTEAGTRLEKHVDPNDVAFALARALFLLKQYANAKIASQLSDWYPHPKNPTVISYSTKETKRLGGVDIPSAKQQTILERLGCNVQETNGQFLVTVPTFRTDIEESADLVEEILRIEGYETIPSLMISGDLPPEQTSPRLRQEEVLRNILTRLQCNEVITSSFIPTQETPETINLENPPDPAHATLRPTLLTNLVAYAKRQLNERAERVAIFEIGKVFYKERNSYKEERMLGILLTGTTDTKSYGKTPRPLTYFDLKGILEMISEELGIQMPMTIQTIDADMVFVECSLDELLHADRRLRPPYRVVSQYPPIIEDLSFILHPSTKTGMILEAIRSFDPLIADVRLLDAYENKRTIRIIYQSPTKNLSSDEVRPIRERIIQKIVQLFDCKFIDHP
ncbi:MAG: phenylalanine--tRNA ligase subunit beta [Patescibacteria group bacterium]|nr:phenylalanine--tRNA ligase subunit beta [Patescibacteria group bacterium]